MFKLALKNFDVIWHPQMLVNQNILLRAEKNIYQVEFLNKVYSKIISNAE